MSNWIDEWGWPAEEDVSCQVCSEEILDPGNEYYDGQEVACPTCGAIHWVCCDSETPIHLHGPDDEVVVPEGEK